MKIICTTIFLLLVQHAFAQDTLTFTAYYGVQRTSIYNAAESGSIDLMKLSDGVLIGFSKKATYNQGGSFFLRRRIVNNAWICYGAQFIGMEQAYKLTRFSGDVYRMKIRLRYAGFPLLFQFDFLRAGKFKFYISGGPQVSVLVYETGAIPYYYRVVNQVDAGGAYKNFTLDVVGISGMSFSLSPQYQLELAARFMYGITDSEDKKFRIVYYDSSQEVFNPDGSFERPATHNIAIGGLIGITRKLR